ncbi:MAG: two-component sensor histidine kinase, partial [Deltaproteobacteria bacterium]
NVRPREGVGGMEHNPKEIKPEVKRFRLVKFFAYMSFIILIVSSFALSMVIYRQSTKVLMETYENHALLIANNLNHQVFHYFTIPVRYQYGKISLREKDQFDLMDKIVRTTIHSLNFETVNIYDTQKGQIAYSTDRDLVGTIGKGGMGYKIALEGKYSSRLVSREDSFLGTWLMDFSKEKKLRTFIPFKAEPPYSYIGILGVFEVIQDLTKEYESILRFRYLIFGVSLLVMFLIFLALLLVVRKAERILAKRAQEQKQLEDQLNQAERLAVLGEMVAGVSHEIKNPLGIIRSTAELLAEKSTHDQEKEKLSSIIVEESGRLNSIVTDFLDFARPQVPDFQDCDLEDVIERNVTFLQTELDRKGVILRNGNPSDRPCTIQADPALLHRAFLNIFINAIQAMENGGNLTIGIEAGKEDYTVAIEDTGVGIRQENLRKIFSPFFTTKEKGSGLGLSIVKNIIEGHRGKVWIESEAGVGTKVYVVLPRKH